MTVVGEGGSGAGREQEEEGGRAVVPEEEEEGYGGWTGHSWCMMLVLDSQRLLIKQVMLTSARH